MSQLRIAAVVGSLGEDSYTRSACRYALSAAAEFESVETDLVDLRSLTLPIYDSDADAAGDTPRLRSRIRREDAVILGSPVYHGSYSSALKNALDYCGFDELKETTVSASVSKRSVGGQSST